MNRAIPSWSTVQSRFEEEAKRFAVIFAYLFVVFAAISFLKAAILQAEGVSWAPWGFAAIKAALAAKFILLGRALHLDRGFRDKPLVWQTLCQSVVFVAFVALLNIIEDAVVGRMHGEGLHDSLAELGGGTPEQIAATTLLLFLVFILFFAFAALNEVIRDKGLYRTFFEERLEFAAVGEN